jgi:hypothetical protein
MFEVFKGSSHPKIKYFLYAILMTLVIIILFQLWGRAIRGADDPAIALDSLRQGGIWLASYHQAVSQGRFSYILTYFLTQLPYQSNDFVLLNLTLITTNLMIFILFYRFLSSLWGRSFAFLNCFIALVLFNWVGGEFNLFHGSPLWCSVGFIFLLLSLTRFNEQCKKRNDQFLLAFFLFFLCTLFYEPFLFYAAIFPIIYFSHNDLNLNKNNFFIFSREFLYRFRFLFLSICIYLICYFGFRLFFPSTYEGTKELHFNSLERTWKTIRRFSFGGVYFSGPYFFGGFMLISGIMTALTTIGLGIVFYLNKISPPEIKKIKIKNVFLTFVSVGLYVFFPNLLYGFIEKYHTWSDIDPYYVGSYLSVFAVTIFVSLAISMLINHLRNTYVKVVAYLLIVAGVGFLGFGNFINAQRVFYFDRIHAHKWPMMIQLLEQASSAIEVNSVLCTTTLMRSFESFNIYDYWSQYISMKLGKEVKLKIKPPDDPECTWVVDYEAVPYTITMSFKQKSTALEFRKSQVAPMPPLDFF